MMWLLLLATVLGCVNTQYVKTANYGVKGGYSHGSQGHQYTAGDNLVKYYGNNTQQQGNAYSGGQNYDSHSVPQLGVCYMEVPTASLVRNPAQVPMGNGSRPDLSRIRTCCSGYIRNIHNHEICDPVCTQECINSLCTAPETCTCFPDHVKNAAGFCISTCPIGCQNGNCAGGECICKDGYKLDLDGKYCLPICQENCGGLGNCTAPNVCNCKSGYEPTPRGSCQLKCNQPCDNGDCVAPNDCRCHRGFTKDPQGLRCIPISPSVAPNYYPHNGYNPVANANGSFTPYSPQNNPSYYPSTPSNYTCDKLSCDNGDCIAPTVCRCHPGYTKDYQGQCMPICAQDCGPSGRCISPNVCGSFPNGYNSTSNGSPTGYNNSNNPSHYPSYPTNHPQHPDNLRPYNSGHSSQPNYPYNGNQRPQYPDSPYYSTDKPNQQLYNISSESQFKPQNPYSPNNQPSYGTYPSSTGQPSPLNQSGTYPSGEPSNPNNLNPNQRPTNRPYYPYYPDPSHPTGSSVNTNYPGQSNQPGHQSSQPNQPSYTPGQHYQPSNNYNSSQPNQPGYNPSNQPGYNPSNQPSYNPSNQPSYNPSYQPGYNPSNQPGYNPSNQPSYNPSNQPGYNPSYHPGYNPSNQTGYNPSNQPGYNPSNQPGYNPSNQPGYNPSNMPNSSYPNQQGHQPGQPSPNPYKPLYPSNQLPNYPYPYDQTGDVSLIPQCSQPCINGICVEGNRCSCNPGYVPDSADPTGSRCIPHCPGGCHNGVCSAPNFCICNVGYRKEQGVKGKSGCVKRIRRAAEP